MNAYQALTAQSEKAMSFAELGKIGGGRGETCPHAADREMGVSTKQHDEKRM